VKKELFSIGFYNLENFFDTKDDPKTQDDAFTPKGFMHWVMKRYLNKAKKIGYVIQNIGRDKTGFPPAVMGLAEIENNQTLKDLLHSKYLRQYPYKFIHFDSNDRRGMDVALLYLENKFEVLETESYPLVLYNDEGQAYNTRDILYCKGKLNDETIHFIINHWPSRREGDIQSKHKRFLAARKVREIIDFISYDELNAKIVIMGDFNADPNEDNINKELIHDDFFNPTAELFFQQQGSLNHQKKWHLFDQIIFSNNFKLHAENRYCFKEIKIYNPKYLKVRKGKYRMLPFRTYLGNNYQGGYSDHFPVYAVLEKNKV